MESEAHLIEDAAAPHRVERFLHHQQRLRVSAAFPVPKQKHQLMRRGKLRRWKKSAPSRIKARLESTERGVEQILGRRLAVTTGRVLMQTAGNGIGRGNDLFVLLAPRLRH